MSVSITKLLAIYNDIQEELVKIKATEEKKANDHLLKLKSRYTELNYLNFSFYGVAELELFDNTCRSISMFVSNLKEFALEINNSDLVEKIKLLALELVDLSLEIGSLQIAFAIKQTEQNKIEIRDKSIQLAKVRFNDASSYLSLFPVDEGRDVEIAKRIKLAKIDIENDINRFEAEMYLSKNDYEKAIAALNKAVHYIKETPLALRSKSMISCLEQFDQSLRTCYWRLGEQHMKDGKFKKAIECFSNLPSWNHIINLNSSTNNIVHDYRLTRALVTCYAGLGDEQVNDDISAAIKSYEQAILFYNVIPAGMQVEMEQGLRETLCAKISDNVKRLLPEIVDSSVDFTLTADEELSRDGIKAFLNDVINAASVEGEHFTSKLIEFLTLMKRLGTAKTEHLSHDLLNVYTDTQSEGRIFAFDDELEKLKVKAAQLSEVTSNLVANVSFEEINSSPEALKNKSAGVESQSTTSTQLPPGSPVKRRLLQDIFSKEEPSPEPMAKRSARTNSFNGNPPEPETPANRSTLTKSR